MTQMGPERTVDQLDIYEFGEIGAFAIAEGMTTERSLRIARAWETVFKFPKNVLGLDAFISTISSFNANGESNLVVELSRKGFEGAQIQVKVVNFIRPEPSLWLIIGSPAGHGHGGVVFGPQSGKVDTVVDYATLSERDGLKLESVDELLEVAKICGLREFGEETLKHQVDVLPEVLGLSTCPLVFISTPSQRGTDTFATSTAYIIQQIHITDILQTCINEFTWFDEEVDFLGWAPHIMFWGWFMRSNARDKGGTPEKVIAMHQLLLKQHLWIPQVKPVVLPASNLGD